MLGRYARSPVGHRDLDALLARLGSDGDLPLVPGQLRHGVGPVAHDVQQDLEELHPIARYRGKVGRRLRLHPDSLPGELDFGQLHDFVHQSADVQGFRTSFPLLEQQLQAIDHIAGVAILRHDGRQSRFDLVKSRGVPAEKTQGRLRVTQDCGQRLIELVCNGVRHLTERGHARQMRHLGSLERESGLSFPALGHIPDRTSRAGRHATLSTLHSTPAAHPANRSFRTDHAKLRLELPSLIA